MGSGWANEDFTLLQVSAGTGFSGIFEYNPSPGAGNLVESIVPAAITDPYGNAVLAGAVNYFTTGGGTILAVQTFHGQITFNTAATEAGPYTARSTITNDPSNTLTLNSPNAVSLGVGGGGNGILINSSSISLQDLTILGSTFFIYASDPAIGGQESWHTPTLTGFGNNGADMVFKYTLKPDNMVELNGEIAATGAYVAGTAFATLPAAYRPPATLNLPITINTGAGADTAALLNVPSNTGNLNIDHAMANGNAALIFARYRLTA